MNRNMIIVVVLILLVGITILEFVQLTALKSKISEGKITTASAPGASGGSVPASVDNLPNMVGGC